MSFTVGKGSEKGSQKEGVLRRGVSRRRPVPPLGEYAPFGVRPTFVKCAFHRKDPRTQKHEIGTPPPAKNSQPTPLNKDFYGHEGFPAEITKNARGP